MFAYTTCLFVATLLRKSACFESMLPTTDENTSFETLIQASLSGCGTSVLNRGDILAHLQLLQNLTSLSVHHNEANWTWDDVCYKAPIHLLDGSGHFDRGYNDLVQQLNPCVIISVADCFWEGSVLAGPRQPLNAVTRQGDIIRVLLGRNVQTGDYEFPETLTWGNLNPGGIIELAQAAAQSVGASISDSHFEMISRVDNHLRTEGITAGYMDKPCLDESNCKPGSDRESNRAPIQAALSSIGEEGCTGISPRYMRWNSTLMLEDLSLNEDETLMSAKFLKSTLVFGSAENLLARNRKRLPENILSTAKLESAIESWKRAMHQYVTDSLLNAKGKQTLHRYSPAS